MTLVQSQKFQNGCHPSYYEELLFIQFREEYDHATEQDVLDLIISLNAHYNALQLYVIIVVDAMGRFMLNNLIASDKVRV